MCVPMVIHSSMTQQPTGSPCLLSKTSSGHFLNQPKGFYTGSSRRETNHQMDRYLKLTELEGAAVHSVLNRLSVRSGYHLSLNDLMNKWGSFVAEIERGYGDSIYEYTNSLSVRDVLEDVCSGVPTAVREIIERALRQVDDRFESATTQSAKPIVAGTADKSDRWFRVPKNLVGELKSDIESEM